MFPFVSLYISFTSFLNVFIHRSFNTLLKYISKYFIFWCNCKWDYCISVICFSVLEKAMAQYSCLENLMDGGAWCATVHGVSKSWTRLSDFTFTFHFHVLEKEMATHSSVLAWRIPGMAEPGGLLSLGSHRVGHDWSSLAAAAAAAGDPGSIPGPGRSPGEGNGNPLQYSGLENSVDYIVRAVAKSWTRLSDWTELKMGIEGNYCCCC